uniref:RHOMBOID-like protein n=1 Tax=Triticum urartu TaxID=4572 RepID=A0A8R7UIK2_TRIUA
LGGREGLADAYGGASQDLPHEAQVSATRGEDCFAISTDPVHQRKHLRGRLRALFGQLGAMLSELFTNWTIYTNKAATLVTLLFVIVVNLAIGILPHMMRPAPWSSSGACSPPPASRSQRS